MPCVKLREQPDDLRVCCSATYMLLGHTSAAAAFVWATRSDRRPCAPAVTGSRSWRVEARWALHVVAGRSCSERDQPYDRDAVTLTGASNLSAVPPPLSLLSPPRSSIPPMQLHNYFKLGTKMPIYAN
jgi:hypothetical protein